MSKAGIRCDDEPKIIIPVNELSPKASELKKKGYAQSQNAVCPECGQKSVWHKRSGWAKRFVDYLYAVNGYDMYTDIACDNCEYSREEYFSRDDDAVNERVDEPYDVAFDEEKCEFFIKYEKEAAL